MRVAHLLPSSTLGGAEIAIARLTQGLAQRGVENVVFAPPDAAHLKPLFFPHVERFEEWRQPGPWLSESASYFTEALSLSHALRQSHIDFVHCSKLSAAMSVGAIAGALASKPVVAHVHLTVDPLPRRLRLLLKAVDHFVFVSKATKEESRLGVADHLHSIVYCGLDASEIASGIERAPDLQTQFDIARDARVVTMVSRISPQKDFATLAEAFPRVVRRAPRAHLLIIGDGPDEYVDRVRGLFSRDALADRVTFSGFRDDAVGLMNRSEVIVLSTHSEGVPLVIIEAMALEKPIVATDVGGIPEAIEDGVSGSLVPPGNVEALADAIERCLEHPGHASDMARNAKRAYEERFTLNRFVTEIEQVYESVLGTRSV